LAAFALACAALVALGGWNYARVGLARHADDLRLRHLASLSGEVQTLLLSDSVTENATFGYVFAPGVYPVMSHGWMRLMGQYLTFRRAVERARLREVVLILLPDVLYTDVDHEGQGRIRYTYTDTIFTRPDEILLMQQLGYAEAGKRFIWLELFMRSFNPASRALPPRRLTHRDQPRPRETLPLTEEARWRHGARATIMHDRDLPVQNQKLLQLFASDCARLAIRCRLAISPMAASLPRMNLDRIRPHIPGVELIDLNDGARFPDEAFPDGLHLAEPEWAAYYRSLLASLGLVRFGVFKPDLPAWNGDKLSFAAGPEDPRWVFAAGFHPRESWGVWTSETEAELFVRLPAHAAGRTLRLTGVANARRGPLSLALALDGGEPCRAVAEAPGEVVMDCPISARAGEVVKLTLTAGYLVSPTEWGIADPRRLGFGLKTLELRP
jgi:hypothetical protein